MGNYPCYLTVLKAETIKKRVITLTNMIELHNGYWAVEVPGNTSDSVIQFNTIYYDYPSAKGGFEGGYIKLPFGTWQIVCMSKEATSEQVKDLIERNGEGWIDYDKDRLHNDIPFPDPVDSFYSLLTSK